jgi:transposase
LSQAGPWSEPLPVDDRFGRPGKGNDKGKVEGLVGFVRRNFMTPLPVAAVLTR